MSIEKETLKKFPWGPVVAVHEIGEYSVVEYHPEVFEKSTGTGRHHEYTNFHPYLNGKDTSQSFDTLDGALIGVIALKYDGLNSQAAYYFSKMIGLDNANPA